MARLFGLFDAARVQLMADRSVPIYRGTVPQPGQVFQYLARLIMDKPEAEREAFFLEKMDVYLRTELATERWKKLNALAVNLRLFVLRAGGILRPARSADETQKAA